MLLVSWNVGGRVRLTPDQAARVAALEPDLVCLQEVTARSVPLWEHALRSLGLHHVAHPPPQPRGLGRRRLSVLTGARLPIAPEPVDGVPWPERVLAARVGSELELVNVHSPISQTPGLVKVRTHEALFEHLKQRGGSPSAVCGDFNTPRREHPDGRVWTFARDRYGNLRPERGERWDQAELALIRGLESHGYRDGFRTVHGYEEREPTWEWPRFGGGWRLDHLIVSRRIRVDFCRYEHAWRREGLSDHSALVADISLMPEPGRMTQPERAPYAPEREDDPGRNRQAAR